LGIYLYKKNKFSSPLRYKQWSPKIATIIKEKPSPEINKRKTNKYIKAVREKFEMVRVKNPKF